MVYSLISTDWKWDCMRYLSKLLLKEYVVFQVEQIRADIRDFRQSSGVDKVIVLWTANTERFCDIIPGVNDTAKNLLAAIQVRETAKIHKTYPEAHKSLSQFQCERL